jgi:hypothetical protein
MKATFGAETEASKICQRILAEVIAAKASNAFGACLRDIILLWVRPSIRPSDYSGTIAPRGFKNFPLTARVKKLWK